MNATEYVRQIELSQQYSVFVHVSDWLLKSVNSSDEYSRVCEEFVLYSFDKNI